MIVAGNARSILGCTEDEFIRLSYLFGIEKKPFLQDEEFSRILAFAEGEREKRDLRDFPPFVDSEFIADVLHVSVKYVNDVLRLSGIGERYLEKRYKRHAYYADCKELWRELCEREH